MMIPVRAHLYVGGAHIISASLREAFGGCRATTVINRKIQAEPERRCPPYVDISLLR